MARRRRRGPTPVQYRGNPIKQAINAANNAATGGANASSGGNPISQAVNTATGAATSGTVASSGSAPSSPVSGATQAASQAAKSARTVTIAKEIQSLYPGLNPTERLFATYSVLAGARYNVAPSLLMGVIRQESGFDPEARGTRGRAQGSTGFTRRTAKQYGVEFGKSPKAIASQVMGAAKYLAELDVNNNPRQAINKYGVNGGKAYVAPVEKAARGYGRLDRIAAGDAQKFVQSPRHFTAPPVGRQERMDRKGPTAISRLARGPQADPAQAVAGAAQAAAQGARTAGGGPAPTERLANQRREDTIPDFRLQGRGPNQQQQNRPNQGTARPRRIANRLERAVDRADPSFKSLDAEQTNVLTTVLDEGRKMGVDDKLMLAAVETGIVESGIRNLNYGDADSQGWRQERAMYYDNPTNVRASARRFFQEAQEAAQPGMTPGQIAQAAQQSAFPERYDQVEGEAMGLLKEYQSASREAIPRPLLSRANQVLGEKATKAILNGGKLVRAPKEGQPSKADQRWGGALGAIHAVLPREFWSEARGDKRTPEENAAVGGSSTSDHLTTNRNSFGADLPPDDNLARQIAKNLGMSSHTGTQTVEKDGVRYQLIWQDSGHYDHIHLGALVTDPSKAPTAGTQGIKVKGTNLMVVEPVVVSASGTTSAASSVGGASATAGSTLAGAVAAAEGKQDARSRAAAANTSISPSPLAPLLNDPRSRLNPNAQPEEDPIARAFRSFRPRR